MIPYLIDNEATLSNRCLPQEWHHIGFVPLHDTIFILYRIHMHSNVISNSSSSSCRQKGYTLQKQIIFTWIRYHVNRSLNSYLYSDLLKKNLIRRKHNCRILSYFKKPSKDNSNTVLFPLTGDYKAKRNATFAMIMKKSW